MDKAYKTIVKKSYCIKRIEDGFSFRTNDDRPCELIIKPDMEIYKGEVLLSAFYSLKISGHIYTYGKSRGESQKKELDGFAKMHEILEKRFCEQSEKEKNLMYNFVDSLRD
jgi:hypothetical protein